MAVRQEKFVYGGYLFRALRHDCKPVDGFRWVLVGRMSRGGSVFHINAQYFATIQDCRKYATKMGRPFYGNK